MNIEKFVYFFFKKKTNAICKLAVASLNYKLIGNLCCWNLLSVFFMRVHPSSSLVLQISHSFSILSELVFNFIYLLQKAGEVYVCVTPESTSSSSLTYGKTQTFSVLTLISLCFCWVNYISLPENTPNFCEWG